MYPISGRFKAALLEPVQTIRIKVEVLDTSGNLVRGGEFYDTGHSGSQVQNIIVDGAVDLDISRGTRRTITLSLLNEAGEFAPTSKWGGMFYVDRMIRAWRGLDFGDTIEWVPVGTFYIDHCDVVVERSISLITLNGSDKWKRLSKAKFAGPVSYAAGTTCNTVLRDMLTRCGVTSWSFEEYSGAALTAKTLQTKLSFEAGDVISDAALKIATDFGLNAYFDPMGRFVCEAYRTPGSVAPVWTYTAGQTTLLLALRATYTDDNLFNQVVVRGTGTKDVIYTSTKADTDPSSVTNLTKIGPRTYYYESDTIASQAAADNAAAKLYYENLVLSEDIGMDAVCNPALEGGDVIVLTESDFSNISQAYRISALNVPLASSRQTIRLQRVVRV